MARIDDPDRLGALKATGLLDSEADPSFDRLTVLATRLVDAPVALVSLVDEDRQFFKSACGLAEGQRETPLSHSFCKHVVADESSLIVEDARTDPRVKDNPAIAELGVVAYLGHPISSPDGQVLGSFCVIDSEPRSWTDEEIDSVRKLAGAVMTEMALRSTLRRAAEREEALLRSEQHYRRLVRTAPDTIFALDPEGRFTELNRAGETLLGRPAAELLGERFDAVLDVPDGDAVDAVFQELIDGREDVVEVDLVVVRPSGERRTVHVCASPIEDGVSGVHGVARDVTERREAEEQHRRNERLASLGTLISGVAHELNNPLAAIRGFCQLLLEDARGDDEREMLETIAREADRSSQIVKELRLLARTVRTEPEQPVDLNDVVRHVVKVRAPDCEAKGIEVKVDLAESLPPVTGVGGRLEQVAMNLMVNAEQALTGVDHDRNIIVRTRRAAGAVSMSVFDNGPGIPPDRLDTIFDPFYSTKDEGGTGLGLSLVHKIVTEHNGRIDVESEYGSGALFTVLLPPATEPAAGQGESQADPSTSARSLRILVVEDERPVRRVLEAMLTRMGHEVHAAENGEGGLRAVREAEEPYDVVLSDLRMPEMGGVDFREHALEVDERYAQRVAFVSGDVNAPEAIQIIEDASVPFLEKPFRQDDLERLIRSMAPADVDGPATSPR